MYTAPFPVIAAVLSFLFLAISIGSVSYFLSLSAARENSVAFRDSRHLIESAFSLLERDINNWAKDYAWWDDTVRFADNTADIKWAEDNIGTYIQDAFGITGSFAVTPALETFFYSPRNTTEKRDALKFLSTGGRVFLEHVQSTAMEKSQALTTYVNDASGFYLVSAAPITKEHPEGVELERKPRPVLVLYKKLDQTLINEVSSQFLIDELKVTASMPDGGLAYLPLNNFNGDTIAFISWTPDKPGDHLFEELLPKISLVSVLLIVTALFVFFAWWRTASQANTEKSRFLAKMSHELRTPLNPIVGFSSMMTNETLGPMPEAYKEYAHDINLCGIHLSAIIEDILDVSRIEAGEMPLNETVFDLAGLIETLPVFNNRILSQSICGTEVPNIHREITDNLPHLKADRLRVQQVLLNLVSNAVKFSNGKDVTIRALKEDSRIVIRIEDQGVGICEADLKRLFQPFMQVGHQSIENRSHGSGLGLIVSRELMNLHDGELMLESELGKGTVAIMIFPSNRTVKPVN